MPRCAGSSAPTASRSATPPLPDQLIVAPATARPVVIGIGDHEMFVASDVAALVRHTQQVAYLDDGELATVTVEGFRSSTLDPRPITKETQSVEVTEQDYAYAQRVHDLPAQGDRRPAAIRRPEPFAAAGPPLLHGPPGWP